MVRPVGADRARSPGEITALVVILCRNVPASITSCTLALGVRVGGGATAMAGLLTGWGIRANRQERGTNPPAA